MDSQEKTFRGTVRAYDLSGDPRRGLSGRARVWLTVNGTWSTTVSLTEPEVMALCELLTKAQHARAR